MQAIFFFGMIGVFFFLVTSVTVGLFQNSTQIKQQRIARTAEIFRQIEFAINDGLLQQAPSLEGVNLTNLQFVRPYVNATPDELDNDPWQTPYEIVGFTESVVLLAANGPLGPSSVRADVTTFGIISAGPDRIRQTPRPANLAQLKFLVAEGDDIIRVFSNYDAVNRIWNRAYEIDNTIEDVAIKAYTDQLRSFLSNPGLVSFNGRSMTRSTVLAEYSMCLADFNPGTEQFNGNVRRADGSVINCNAYSAANVSSCAQRVGGRVSISPQTAACWMRDPNMINVNGYPHMAGSNNLAALPTVSSLAPNTLGVEHEVGRDPFGGNVVLEFNKNTPHRLLIRRNYVDSDWQINYYREIVGVDPTAL
jgi:hypothetical protein